MATTDRPRGTDATAVATACRDASFAHVVARADGDALAAAAIVSAACDAHGTPYQVSAVRTRTAFDARLAATDDAATPIAIGASADCPVIDASPASPVAFEAAAELGASPDPVMALAGVVAAGGVPGTVAASLLDEAAVERQPGVAVPTDDLADGLAHTTLVHADFSGDPEAVRVDDDADPREVASMLALAAAGAPAASDRAGTSVERALRPYVGGPFETVGGYADVLCALAHRAPGVGVALGLGRDVRESALSHWRERSRAAHAGVREATTARYEGLVIARTDGPVEPVARLLRDFRSPEPVVLAVSDGDAALATVEASAAPLEVATERADGSALVSGCRGYARFDGSAETLIEAVREAL